MNLSTRPTRHLLAAMALSIAWPMLSGNTVRGASGQDASAAADGGSNTRQAETAKTYEDIYRGYKPDFIVRDVNRWVKRGREDPLKLSYQKRFFNMAYVEEDSRVDALIEFGRTREGKGEYRDAMAAYRKVIVEYPHVLYRIAPHGIFIPARRYCQRRILAFPPKELAFYRAMFDAPARDAFERARRRYSLADLREVAELMMATSYGAPALFELGNAALDNGHFEEALAYYRQVRDEFSGADLDTAELILKIAYCRKALGLEVQGPGNPTPNRRPVGAGNALTTTPRLTAAQRTALMAAIGRLKASVPPFRVQRATPPFDSPADYTLFPPTADAINTDPPVWRQLMPVSHRDLSIYTYPVATKDSLIFRHKNIVYCRSLISGALRWKNDLGGRVRWWNQSDAFFPSEEVLVKDGLVFTNMYKGGASLVALDEVTGRLRWAHGPIAPVTEEDGRTSYFACPVGGRRAVYAPFVVDNIEGETHIDSVYGVRAFDSTTGRILWSRELCRLNVGKFMLSELVTIRNRIRSYSTPPVLHEGILYCSTNAGVFAAVEAASGTIRWVTRYPYLRSIHDRTRALGIGTYRAGLGIGELARALWYNQRPLLLGDRMYVLPVDADYIFCIDRPTGKILWSRVKGHLVPYQRGSRWITGQEGYLVGVIPGDRLAGAPLPRKADKRDIQKPCQPDRDYLLVAYSGPKYSILLHDADTGEPVWNGAGLFDSLLRWTPRGEHLLHRVSWGTINARPFLTADLKLYVPRVIPRIHYYMGGGRNLYWVVDVKNRTLLKRRIYFDGQYLANAARLIAEAKRDYADIMKNFPDRKPEPHWSQSVLPYKDADVPVNEHGPFFPFSRMTFERHGVQFELFVGPRVMKMKYDRKALERALAQKEQGVADALSPL